MSCVDTINVTIRFGKGNNTSADSLSSTRNNAVTQIRGYADNEFIYGIKLFWGDTSYMYGSSQNLTGVTLDCRNSPVWKIKYYVSSDGYLQGLQFYTDSNNILLGRACPDDFAFKMTGDVLTDMRAYIGTQNKKSTISGVRFFYTGPPYTPTLYTPSPTNQTNNFQIQILSWPALGALAHTSVAIKSLMNVGKLRSQLAIKAPTCDPPLTTSPSDSQLWYRTFRAQENCKEMLLIYLPSILIASTFGYHAFGKWVPRAVGTLAIAGAFFRYKYMTAYIEDADKRGKPFYLANMCMKPIFLLAVLSAGYLFGKELYHTIMGHASSSSSSGSSEEEEKEENE